MKMFRPIGFSIVLLSLAAIPTFALAQAYSGNTTSQTAIDDNGVASTPPSASPQPAMPQVSPQVRADTARAMAYPLPQDFMLRAAAAISELQARNIQPPNSRGSALDETIQRVAQVPGLAPILESHGFTPENFVMGMTAFGMTLAASNGQLPNGMPAPNPSNIELFKAHPDQVNALMQAMGNPPH